MDRTTKRLVDRILLWLIGGFIAIGFLFGWQWLPASCREGPHGQRYNTTESVK